MAKLFVRASDVKSMRRAFLWPPYIPSGVLTGIQGNPGSCKSTLACHLIGCLTSGRPFRGQNDAPPLGGALYISAEETKEELRARLDANGAELCRVGIADLTSSWKLSPKGVDRLQSLTARYQARLIIIDPITAFLGPRSCSETGAREGLGLLARMAAELNVAVVLLRHLRKMAGSAMHAGLGSIAFTALVRSLLHMGVDPVQPGQRILASAKNSFGPPPPSLSFEPIGDRESQRLEWRGTSTLNADDLAAATAGSHDTALSEATFVVYSILGDGPLLAKEVKSAATAAGVAERTLRRAKKVLGVKSQRVGFGPESEFYWQLPGATELEKSLRDHDLDDLYYKLINGAKSPAFTPSVFTDESKSDEEEGKSPTPGA